MSSAKPPSSPDTQGHPPLRSAASLKFEGSGSGPRLVLAHGFTQTGRVWAGMNDDLATDHHVVQVDMPGHGRSTEVAVGLVDGARLLVEAGGKATYVGYSMGARFCLHAALAHPELVERLVLVSGTAGIDSLLERQERRRSDRALADQLDPAGGSAAPLPVETFLRRWMDSPMFSGISVEAGGFEERLANSGPGLATSLRLAGTGTQVPMWGALGQLTMPVLVITGQLDEKFAALGIRMVEAIGANATGVVVAGAGHAPHLQRPGEVAELVRGFVSHSARR